MDRPEDISASSTSNRPMLLTIGLAIGLPFTVLIIIWIILVLRAYFNFKKPYQRTHNNRTICPANNTQTINSISLYSNMPNVPNSDIISYNEAISDCKYENGENLKNDDKLPTYQDIFKNRTTILVNEQI